MNDASAWPEIVRKARAGWTSPRIAALLVLFLTGALAWGLLWWDSRGAGPRSPTLPIALAALVALGVAAVWPGGLVDRRRRARVERRRRARPDEPWLWDHVWDPAGVSLSARGRVLRASTFPAAWLAPQLLNAAAHAARQPLLWLPAGLVLSWWAWRIFRVVGGGTSHVSFAKFPFAPGERAVLRFGTSAGGASFESVGFFLRRVVEKPGSPFKSEHLVFDCESIEARPAEGLLPGPDQDVEIAFDVPADVAATRLAAALPSYWVLDVVGTTSAGPYAESFLVPIYERPATGAAL